MKELIGKIAQWHVDRNLIDGATDESQYKKLRSEFGEYSDNDAKGTPTIDDIGDMGVVVINIAERNGLIDVLESNPTTIHNSNYHSLDVAISDMGFVIFDEVKAFYSESMLEVVEVLWETLRDIAKQSGYDLEDCLSHAYDDIKDRKGKMINGTFVKE